MKFKSIRTAGVVLGILLLSASLCLAQATFGVIAGVVTDSTDAVVQGATVNIERTEGGAKKTSTTGPNGEYRIESLTPGTYKVTVSAPNFSSTQISEVQVYSSVTTPLSVKLEVGKASDTVTVEAGGVQIQTETGDLSGVIPITQVKDLPIASGNPYALATTLPGVSTPDVRDDFTNGVGFSVDGLRPRANNFLIDGFDNNDYGITGQALQPTNQEAVSEVTVLKNAYTAEYGRGGGSVSNVTIRSGTNKIHGAAWEQYSGSSLNAVQPEEAASGLTRPAHQVNNLYGFRVGGPVIKDKLFYFGTAQWSRNFGAQPAAQLTLPTAAGVATLESLGTNSNVQLLIDSLGGLRGSTADPNQVGSVNISDRAGCTPCFVETGPLTRTDGSKGLSREWMARADYLPTSTDTVYVRYTDTHTSLTPDLFANPTALPTADTEQGGPARNLGVMWAHTFSPSVVNELRFSAQQIDFAFAPTASSLANPNANAPGITLASSFGPTVWGGFSQATFPQGRAHKTFQFQDAVSLNKGSHTFKIGTDLAIILVNDAVPFNSDGTMVFNGDDPQGAPNCLTDGTPSFCTDLANYVDDFSGPGAAISKQFGNPNINVPTSQQAYYIQDTWKVRPNITLNLGLRYEYQPPDANNVLAFPGANRNAVLDPNGNPFLVNGSPAKVKPDRNNWGPRFGFAYSPKMWSRVFGDNKTVIRGGAGVFFDSFFTNISDNSATTFPNTLGGTIFGPPGRGTPNALAALASITPTSDPTDTVFSVPNDLRNPMTYQWNLNVQRELPAHLIAEVAYVGTRGERLWVNEQLNPGDVSTLDPNTGAEDRFNPNRGSFIVRGNRGDSIYHGLQAEVNRNFGRLSIRGSYTYSKVLDNGSEIFATSGGASRWQDVRDPRSDRGPSAFDRKHRAAITWIYELPSPSHGFLKSVLGGWESGGAISFQSGAPETIFFGGFDQNADLETFNDRPSLGNPNAAVDNTSNCILDPSCISGIGVDLGGGTFVDFQKAIFLGEIVQADRSQFKYLANLNNQNGNIARNSLYLPGQQNWNLTAIKRFHVPITEESNVEFRADFFNAFNHPNLGINIAGVGNILAPDLFLNMQSTKSGSRAIQMWLKLSF